MPSFCEGSVTVRTHAPLQKGTKTLWARSKKMLPVLQFFIAKESTAATLLFPLATYSSEIRNGFSRCPTLLWSNTHLVSSYSDRKEQRRRVVRKATLQAPNPPKQQLHKWLVTLCLLPQTSHSSWCPIVIAFPSNGFCKSKLLIIKTSTQLRCGKPS